MPNCYMDSILILSVSREMMKLPTVHKAVVVMATDMNKTVVDEFGGMIPAVRSAGPNDLILSLDCDQENVIKMAEEKVKEIVGGKSSAARDEAQVEYRKLTAQETNVIFGGRLAQYKYYDMAPIIEQVLNIENF